MIKSSSAIWLLEKELRKCTLEAQPHDHWIHFTKREGSMTLQWHALFPFYFADRLRPCYSPIGFSATRRRDLHISFHPMVTDFIVISSPHFVWYFFVSACIFDILSNSIASSATMFQFNALSQYRRRFALLSPSVFLFLGAIVAQSFNASTVDLSTRSEWFSFPPPQKKNCRFIMLTNLQRCGVKPS